MTAPWVTLDRSGPAAILSLNRPDRQNSLVPELLDTLIDALNAVARSDARAVVLTGAGRSFSTGGDLRGFWDHRADIAGYAGGLVGQLNQAILTLDALPLPTIAQVNGPVTGGSVGLMLACDLVAMSETAFIQPYYARVGFAPDGGWTVLMPERIGRARTARMLLLDERLDGRRALAAGIADAAADPADLHRPCSYWISAIAAGDAGTHAATLSRLRDTDRRARLAAALEAERTAFVDRIATPAALSGMARFLGIAPETDCVE